jgi:hypothetical protein
MSLNPQRAERLSGSLAALFHASYSCAGAGRPKGVWQSDLADALAFALRYQGRKRVHKADEMMSKIVAKRLVEHLERDGFVVMKRAPIVGGAALGRGFEE